MWFAIRGSGMEFEAQSLVRGSAEGAALRLYEPISFWGFTKYGVVVTAATLVVAWLYVYLRYFTFA